MFEERLAKRRRSEIARRCLRKLKEKGRRGVTRSRWKKKKTRFFEERRN